LSPEARALHSVNTVLFRGGRRIGHNTDWWGFAESFRREMSDVNPRRSCSSAPAAPALLSATRC
jgi:shikimate dehydrogenase